MELALHIAINVLETIGATIIVGAAGLTVWDLTRAGLARRLGISAEPARLQFAQRLVLALEFLIAADILATLHTLTLEHVALLGAIIAVRTVLSLSIAYELRRLPSAMAPSDPSASLQIGHKPPDAAEPTGLSG